MNLRLLLAEDNVVNQKVAVRMLEKWGHAVQVVSNGRQAVEAVAHLDFDAILMDMEMPNIDGPTATQIIRALPDKEKSSVPVIAMTANVMKEDIMRCIKAGMNDYCSKPIDPENLRAMLAHVANKEGSFKAVPVTMTSGPTPTLPAFVTPELPQRQKMRRRRAEQRIGQRDFSAPGFVRQVRQRDRGDPPPTPFHQSRHVYHMSRFATFRPPSPSPVTACAIRTAAAASGRIASDAASYNAARTARGATD